MAYGTESVPGVDKICGPGNIYATLAKKLVFGVVGIDGLYGPSEVLIIADDTANAEYCAADMLAQAEHDSASAVLITTSRQLITRVDQAIKEQIGDLSRREVARDSIDKRGVTVLVENIDEAIELANLYAPEHLCLFVTNAGSYVDRINNAGCIFVGEDSIEVLVDYVAGPSHVLPTGGTARFGSPLNVTDFVKIINIASMDSNDLKAMGRDASIIARAEGLDAHARAVEKRLESSG
jgi:histidinol dehydrogenase